MTTVVNFLLFCFISFALFACNLIPNVDEESLPRTARVAVVSLMYDYMDYVNFSRLPMSSSKSTSHYVSEWKLNEFAENAASGHLKDRFELIEITYSPTILKRGFNNTNFYTGLPIYYIHTVEKHYKKIVATYDLDAIIVVVQNYTKPSAFRKAYSYGLLYKNLFKPKLQSFAAISLRIYDAKSLNVIALAENVDAFVNIEGTTAYPSFNHYSEDEQMELKLWVEKAIDTAIFSALSEMKLTSEKKSFFIF